jgi:hypothetical protein
VPGAMTRNTVLAMIVRQPVSPAEWVENTYNRRGAQLLASQLA